MTVKITDDEVYWEPTSGRLWPWLLAVIVTVALVGWWL